MKRDFYWPIMCSLLIICIMLATSGCGMTDSTAVEISGKVIDRIPQDIGRFSAWTAAIAAQEATKQKEAEVAKAEAEVEKARISNTQAPDTPEKMAIASMLEMGKAMSKAIVAMAKGDKAETIPMPKGAVAEGIDSATGLVVGVANSPTAIASAVSVGAVQMTRAAVSSAGDKTIITGNENSTTSTKTKTTNINQASGVESAVNTGDQSKNEGVAEEVSEEVAE